MYGEWRRAGRESSGDCLLMTVTWIYCKEIIIILVFLLEEDDKGQVWMGTRGDGLCIGDRWYVHRTDDANSLAHNHIYDIYRDYRDRMWIGTFGEDSIWLFIRKTISCFIIFEGSFGEQEVRTITADRNHWMWVGTNNGIYVFHPDSLLNDSRQYYVYNLDNGKIRSNEIRNIFVTAKVVCGLEPPVKAFLSASQDKLMISWNSGIMMKMTGW